jgi:ribose 5-phosphate isomerase B
MNIVIGSDHAGFRLKELVKSHLERRGHRVEDAGPSAPESCDYPVYGLKVARRVASGAYEQGVLICGTGLGMSMAANRVRGARAALCTSEFQARMARAHNDANILVLGERVVGSELALAILDAYLETRFEGGRHERRVALLDQMD